MAAVGGIVLLTVTGRAFAASAATELVREARAHEAANQEEIALRRYSDAISLDPSYGDAYLGLGALRMRRGDAREAERVYTAALMHVPAMKVALVGRAEARWALGFRAEAESDLEEYVRVQEEPGPLRELASWYGLEGRMVAQLAVWRRIRAAGARSGDVPLEHEARRMVRALQLLVDPVDPVTTPPVPDPVRLGIAAIAKRGG